MASHDRRGLRGYYRIPTGDVDRVRHAIAAGFPVVGGWLVDRVFLDWSGAGIIGPQDADAIVGGHAMAIVAYAGDEFRLANSWGVRWGAGGFALARASFIAAARDVWALDVGGP